MFAIALLGIAHAFHFDAGIGPASVCLYHPPARTCGPDG